MTDVDPRRDYEPYDPELLCPECTPGWEPPRRMTPDDDGAEFRGGDSAGWALIVALMALAGVAYVLTVVWPWVLFSVVVGVLIGVVPAALLYTYFRSKGEA